ncbi:BlaI/MecI/CopY family transcriptional regulator [Arenicella xantha]|uniref:Putative transcriptional regulator n=1 Tax=Arenicella xantha TaxID=644221 RepID=A0A395JFV4_9GAMM|nr:BlaI/MecI/CopY family transcriptional regulator [Arenicella xantha]RBP48548.1 putative transcriptional regulator [Arenicella xantha]
MTPNSTELEILKLLWKKQPQTAKEIHQHLESKHWWSYSSTRKTLERMGNKGILEIGTLGNKKTYKALLEKIPTLASYMQEFATNILELDTPLPVTMFADSRLIDNEEIDELEQLLNQLSEQKEEN